MAKTCPESFWKLMDLALAGMASVYVLLVGVDVFLWVKHPAEDTGTRLGKLKASLGSLCFWIALCFTLLVVLFLNFIPYYRSYGAYRADGVEVAGWPLHFWVCGGDVYTEHIDVLASFVDVLAAITFPVATGIAFRNGAGLLFRRGRIVLRKLLREARAWPRE